MFSSVFLLFKEKQLFQKNCFCSCSFFMHTKFNFLRFLWIVSLACSWPGLCRLLFSLAVWPSSTRQQTLGTWARQDYQRDCQQIRGSQAQGQIQQVSSCFWVLPCVARSRLSFERMAQLGCLRADPQLLQQPTVGPWGACLDRGGGAGTLMRKPEEIPFASAWQCLGDAYTCLENRSWAGRRAGIAAGWLTSYIGMLYNTGINNFK